MDLGTRRLRAVLLGLSVAIGVLLAWQHGPNFFLSFDIRKIGSVEAPDRAATLDHCSSRTDTRPDHHAPYGDHVFFRQSRFPAQDCSGTLIFAGYCQDLEISWSEATGIEFVCTGAGEVITLNSVIRGTKVTLRKKSKEAEGNTRHKGSVERMQRTPPKQ